MRLPGLAPLLVVTCLASSELARAATTTTPASGAAAVQLVAEPAPAPVEDQGKDEGGGGFVTGLSSAGLGCLVGVLPSAFMGFACGVLGAPCAFPCLLLGTGGGALLGAGIESGFAGPRLFAPTLVGGLIGGGLGLIAATAGVVTALVGGNTAGRVSPDTGLAVNATAVGVLTGAVVGGITLVGALGAGIGAGIAYALSAGSDEVPAATPPPLEVAPPPIDEPRPEDSQPAPAETQPEPPAEQPASDDPDMKGFFY